jgi:glycosyltransferase involved in cell wall biosynthesis
MKIALSHPTGNSNVRAILEGLQEADALAEFHTTIAADAGAQWLRLLPGSLRQEWLRRAFRVPTYQVRTHPWREVARMVLPRLGLTQVVRHEAGWASVDAVYQGLDKAVARRVAYLRATQAPAAVYAYEDGALATFRQAKKLGVKCIYDLPIAYWETSRTLMTEEAVRLPAWAATLGGGISDSSTKLQRKTCELELADVVVVPSQFVRDSLPPWAAGKPIIVAPFGSPASPPHRQWQREKSGPLRVLFVGSMSQRKGLGDLFAALRLLNSCDVELVVMGAPVVELEFYRKELPSFTYEPGRPHAQVLALMQSCDVFCLPSIVEGRALVMQEAMSQGLPLIITPNTGGADLVQEGQTGFLVPIRSPDAIAEKLEWFLANRKAIPAMGRLAQAYAAQYTWESYRTNIITALLNLLR